MQRGLVPDHLCCFDEAQKRPASLSLDAWDGALAGVLRVPLHVGILVSQINEIVAAKQVKTKELDDILDAYLSINPRHGLNEALVYASCIKIVAMT
jgi:hypothetical protein